MNDDLNDALADDMRRAQRAVSGGGPSLSPAAMLEAVFATLAAATMLAWLVAMVLWVPDPIPGHVWMGFGLFGMAVFAAPAGAIYVLRRGGAGVIRAMVREQVR